MCRIEKKNTLHFEGCNEYSFKKNQFKAVSIRITRFVSGWNSVKFKIMSVFIPRIMAVSDYERQSWIHIQ